MIDVLFVCYGNICRSPAAEALLDAHLKQLLGPEHDVVVASAGVGAMDGLEATKEARRSVEMRGSDLSAHRSQRVTPQLLRRSARVYCMEPNQVQFCSDLAADVRVELLGDGVEDPIGCTQWVYDSVTDKIDRLVSKLAVQIAAERGSAPAASGGA